MYKRLILTGFLIIVAIAANAETSSGNTTVVIQKQMFLGDFIYPYNVDGTRMLVNDIQFNNVDLYNRLNPVVSDMERKRIFGFTVGGIFFSGGIAVAILGFTVFGDKVSSDMTMPNMYCMFGAVGLFGAGMGLGFLLQPNENDVLAFINRHNSLSETKITVH